MDDDDDDDDAAKLHYSSSRHVVRYECSVDSITSAAAATTGGGVQLFGFRLLRHEGGYVSDGPAEDEGVDVVRAFVGVHGL